MQYTLQTIIFTEPHSSSLNEIMISSHCHLTNLHTQCVILLDWNSCKYNIVFTEICGIPKI